MNGRACFAGALAVATLSFGAAGAQAQPSRDSSAAAEALFQEGVTLSENGQWQKACEKFAASEELDVAVGTLLRLGDCYERVGRLASAWARFREAGSLAQTQNMPEREQLARQRAEALEPRLARLTITPPSEIPPGFQVTSHNEPVPKASWGSALPVDAGELIVEARAPGYLTFSRSVTIPTTPGASLTVTIPALEPEAVSSVREPAAAPSRHAKPATRHRPASDRGYAARATGVTFAVVGGVGLLGAAGLTLMSSQRNDESLKHCPNGPRLCSARGVQLREEATTLADMATLSASAGGGLLATGLVVYVIGARREPREQAALQVVPDVGISSVALQARGSF